MSKRKQVLNSVGFKQRISKVTKAISESDEAVRRTTMKIYRDMRGIEFIEMVRESFPERVVWGPKWNHPFKDLGNRVSSRGYSKCKDPRNKSVLEE